MEEKKQRKGGRGEERERGRKRGKGGKEEGMGLIKQDSRLVTALPHSNGDWLSHRQLLRLPFGRGGAVWYLLDYN